MSFTWLSFHRLLVNTKQHRTIICYSISNIDNQSQHLILLEFNIPSVSFNINHHFLSLSLSLSTNQSKFVCLSNISFSLSIISLTLSSFIHPLIHPPIHTHYSSLTSISLSLFIHTHSHHSLSLTHHSFKHILLSHIALSLIHSSTHIIYIYISIYISRPSKPSHLECNHSYIQWLFPMFEGRCAHRPHRGLWRRYSLFLFHFTVPWTRDHLFLSSFPFYCTMNLWSSLSPFLLYCKIGIRSSLSLSLSLHFHFGVK